MSGRHVWLSDEFSVPEETLCLIAAPSPDADHRCVRAKDHPGKHEFRYEIDYRQYSWKILRDTPKE